MEQDAAKGLVTEVCGERFDPDKANCQKSKAALRIFAGNSLLCLNANIEPINFVCLGKRWMICRRLRPGDVGGQTRFPVGTLDQTVPDSRGYGNFGPLGCLFAVGKAAQLSGSGLIIRPDVQSGQFHRSRDHYHLLLARNFPIRPERAILIAANDPELS